MLGWLEALSPVFTIPQCCSLPYALLGLRPAFHWRGFGPHGRVKEWCAVSAHHSLTQPCGPKPRQWKAGLTITLCDFERKGILVIAVSRPLFPNKFQCIMYRWYVLWVDIQVNLQSSDQLIKITQTESGAVPVMTFLQCQPPPPCFQINYNVLCTADMSDG